MVHPGESSSSSFSTPPQTVIALAAEDEDWFNSSRRLYEDVEETVGLIEGIEALAREEGGPKKPLEGAAIGNLVKIAYRIAAQPPPFTLLVADEAGYAALDYCGFHLELAVSPKGRREGDDDRDVVPKSCPPE